MKNKKLIIVFGAIAVLLIAILIDKSRKSSDIPTIHPWKGDVNEISITKPDGNINLLKKDGKWTINNRDFILDNEKIERLIGHLRDIMITDFITKRPLYEQYSLSDDKGMRVKVKQNGGLVRDLIVGGPSVATYRHTYVKFPDKPEIYLVAGRLDAEVRQNENDYRSLEIFALGHEDIQSLELKYQGSAVTLIKKMKVMGKPEKTEGKTEQEGLDTEFFWVFKGSESTLLNQKKASEIIATFGSLRALYYPDVKKEILGPAVCTITLTAAKKKIIYSIHNKEKAYGIAPKQIAKGADDVYYCTSSVTPYVFAVSQFGAERFFINMNYFTGP
jgi:hypothetical protein